MPGPARSGPTARFMPRASRAMKILLVVAIPSVWGCAARATSVSPAEIEPIEARLEFEPNNGALRHRYAAALYSADRCVDAVRQVDRAMEIEPNNVLGPLVAGRCLERDDRFEEAVELYSTFILAYPNARGIQAVHGQQRLAEQARAVARIRAAVDADSVAGAGEAEPDVVAILPLMVEGDSTYRSLSKGLATLMMSDLALLQRFRLVERLEMEAISNELDMSRSGAVDPSTVARVGRVMRAGQTVQGVADVSQQDEARLVATVLASGSSAPQTVEQAGLLEEILDVQKDLVLSLSEAMGYTPTPADIARIRANGTRSLVALLAFSRGLEAQDAGDFDAAATFFQAAIAEDPGFAQAGTELQTSAASGAVADRAPGDVTTLAADAEEATQPETDLGGALDSSITDVATLDGEGATTGSGEADATQELTILTNAPPPPAQLLQAMVRLLVIFPGGR